MKTIKNSNKLNKNNSLIESFNLEHGIDELKTLIEQLSKNKIHINLNYELTCSVFFYN